MDILKLFNLYDKEIQINIKGTIEDPLFQANQIGKLLTIKNIRSTIEKFDEDEKKDDVDTIDTIGRKQKATFLTEIGLYRLLGMSRKEEARIFQKWVCNVIKEIRLKGIYELNNQKEIDKKINERKIELERHNTLLSSFHNKNVIYICVLDNYRNIEDTDNSVYKIGWSNNFKRRFTELNKTYGPVTILYIYECNNNIDFERFLFKHPDISYHKYNVKITKTNTREKFLLSPDELYKILEIIKKNIGNYQSYNTDQLMELKRMDTKNKELEVELYKKKLEIIKLQNTNIIKEDDISIISEEEVINNNQEIFNEDIKDEKIEYEWKEGDTLFDIRKKNNTKSPYIQKYDPNTFELLETYDSIIDLIRKDDNLSYSGLKKSVKSNTIYNNFRWFFVDKKKENIKYNLEPTVIIKNVKYNEYIAMLNIDKNKIIEVYPSQKEASIARKFSNGASINLALKNGSLSSGHYWMKYDDCSDELKLTYNKQLPEKKSSSTSKKVNILHKTTKEIIKTYNCIMDVLKEFQMSRTTLNKINKNNEIYKGFYFQIL